jgi:hypothetical protein
MEITLYKKITNKAGSYFENIGSYRFLDRNIKIPNGKLIEFINLYNKAETYLHFTIDRSDVYSDMSKGLVNTRISYIHIDKSTLHRFCKINFIQYNYLLVINKQHFFQKHENIRWVISLIGGFGIGFLTKVILGC